MEEFKVINVSNEELVAKGQVLKLFCIICGKPFYIWKSRRKGLQAQGMRWANSVTCSEVCSETRKMQSKSLSNKRQGANNNDEKGNTCN